MHQTGMTRFNLIQSDTNTPQAEEYGKKIQGEFMLILNGVRVRNLTFTRNLNFIPSRKLT